MSQLSVFPHVAQGRLGPKSRGRVCLTAPSPLGDILTLARKQESEWKSSNKF